jgi:plasmid stabilization system protein ParE
VQEDLKGIKEYIEKEDNTISIQRVLHGSRDYISLFNEYLPN